MSRPWPHRTLLYLPAKLYELGVRLRIALYESDYLRPRRLNAPVISVGNLTTGGTGKTPLVSFLARYLRDEGYSVVILSRGYKRESRGRVEVSDQERVLCGPHRSGDEPYLLARQCAGVRVIVDKDRYAAGKWLEERTPVDVFILDDGYQHLGLARDLNLVLVDATEPLLRAEMVPFGHLREPLTELRRADAVIITRADEPFDQAEVRSVIAACCREGAQLFYAYHDVTGLRRLNSTTQRSDRLNGEGAGAIISPLKFTRRPVAAVCGIARPDRFVADLCHYGISIVLRRDFGDHHRYRREEWLEIARQAQAAGAEAIIITEKDAVNLPDEAVASSALPIYAAQIEFRCEEEIALKQLVLRAMLRGRK